MRIQLHRLIWWQQNVWIPTLDGMKFWQDAFPGERNAVEWLRANARPNEVVWEALGPAYSRHGRFAAFAGRPALLGWANHQWVWRKGGHVLTAEREAAVERVKRDPTVKVLRGFLRKYHVRWMVVGTLERKQYSLQLLTAMATYPVAYASITTTVYRVR